MNKILTIFLFLISFFSNGQLDEIKVFYDDAESSLNQGNLTNAIENGLKALNLAGKNELPNWEARCNLLLGDAYMEQKKYNKAIPSFESTLIFLHKQGNKEGEAYSYSMLGDAYEMQKNDKKAIKNYKKAFELYKELTDNENCAYLASDIGKSAERLGHDEKAVEWITKAVQYSSSANLNKTEVEQLILIGGLYSNFGNYSKAKEYLKKAKNKAQEYSLSTLEDEIVNAIKTVEYNVSNQVQNITQYETEEVEKKEEYIANIKSLQVKTLEEIEKLSEEKQLVELKLKAQKNEYEKKILNEQLKTLQTEKELEMIAANLKIKDVELDKEKALREKRKSQIIGLSVALFLIFAVAFLSIIGYNNKKKSNRELNIKNEKISLQHSLLESTTRQITDSINYAKKIQTAFLPGRETFKKQFDDSFIYFNPRDKVSGDFFWHYEKDGLLYAVVADCTGHGVPGAFMSIVCSSIFESVLLETDVISPNEILELCNERLIQKLKKYQKKHTSIKDGMDVAVICIDKKNNKLRYSGARNSIYICRKDKLIELKATRRSIAFNDNNSIPKPPFQEEVVAIESNDMIYLFSDGFADQKGGPKRKKYFYKPFKNLLLNISKKEMEEQRLTLKKTFIEWKKEEEQIDDVLVIGIKI